MSGVSSSGMVSSVSSSHASSSEGLGSSDGAAPKRSRSAPLSEKKRDVVARIGSAFAAATAPGGGRLDASVFFLDADALAALRIGDAPFVGKKAKGAYRDEIGGDAYAAADAYAYASRASAAAEKEAEKEKGAPSERGELEGARDAVPGHLARLGEGASVRAVFLSAGGGRRGRPPPQPRRDRARDVRRGGTRRERRRASRRFEPARIAQRGDGAGRTRRAESGLPSTGPGPGSSSVFPRPS